MRKCSLVLVFLFIISFSVYPEFSEEEARLLAEINRVRQNYNAGSLGWDTILAAAAEDYAGESFNQGYLSHLDGRGGYAVHRVQRNGGTALKVGEVLGSGPSGIEGIVSAWMDSLPHRRILLDKEWTHAGGAVLETETGYLIVLLFQIRPFSTIQLTNEGGLFRIRLYREEPSADVPVIFSRGKLFEAAGPGAEAEFLLDEAQVFYHLLIGIRRNREIVFTDRVFLSHVLTQ